MLIDHRFDITDLLNPDGNNSIYVRIDHTVAAARKYINGNIGSRKFFRVEQEYVRKAPHMYGWDIMPAYCLKYIYGVYEVITKPLFIPMLMPIL